MLETGLHFNWHRWYDATTGRYTQPDPLGLEAGASRYAYALNSPLMYVDSTGESAAGVVGGFIGADISIPDPSDAAWPKWATYGAAMCVAVGVDYFGEQIMQMGKKSDKEKSTRRPSWAEGEKTLPGESGREFGDRLMDKKYGNG
ncbi:MAG: RHS repeat-associated core domain-containing protein [Rhizobiales bacterium]|nr:RHS repeat-associated core domain-containing protein [Hyphomicrobiales bacterium]